ncbi:MAG TPA: response regulator [Methylomirabilota bacterium]|jgi:CheY-like chemotaxis protein|nr:response regulator [Methylomirabilota bacterium]
MRVDTGNARVLIVEDDRFLRRVHEVGLRQRGFTVLTAADGEEGLRVARTEHPDVVLLDLVMPKLQGFEVLRLLKADPATEAIPVVILSSLGGDGDVQAALKHGAASYVLKSNLSVQTLVSKVQEALGAGQPRAGD